MEARRFFHLELQLQKELKVQQQQRFETLKASSQLLDCQHQQQEALQWQNNALWALEFGWKAIMDKHARKLEEAAQGTDAPRGLFQDNPQETAGPSQPWAGHEVLPLTQVGCPGNAQLSLGIVMNMI